jgi:hypothetical protein
MEDEQAEAQHLQHLKLEPQKVAHGRSRLVPVQAAHGLVHRRGGDGRLLGLGRDHHHGGQQQLRRVCVDALEKQHALQQHGRRSADTLVALLGAAVRVKKLRQHAHQLERAVHEFGHALRRGGARAAAVRRTSKRGLGRLGPQPLRAVRRPSKLLRCPAGKRSPNPGHLGNNKNYK